MIASISINKKDTHSFYHSLQLSCNIRLKDWRNIKRLFKFQVQPLENFFKHKKIGKKRDTFSTFYHRFWNREEAARRWVRECELCSFYTYPVQTWADCQGSDTSLNGQPITAVKNLHLQLNSSLLLCLWAAHQDCSHTVSNDNTLRNFSFGGIR